METIEKEVQTKIVKDNIELLILKIANQQPTYGYQIMTAINKTYNTQFGPSIIYPTLTQLEQKKYLTSTWINTTTRPRKIFTITPQGQKFLETYQTTLNQFHTTLNNPL